ncbi:unnamed protein product, partial [marine sediment metagenome]
KIKTAILCSSDEYAIEVYNHLSGNDLKIPHDVGIMGFDNIKTLSSFKPQISTVDYKINEIGERAVEVLQKKRIGKEKKILDRIIIQHKIIPGETI